MATRRRHAPRCKDDGGRYGAVPVLWRAMRRGRVHQWHALARRMRQEHRPRIDVASDQGRCDQRVERSSDARGAGSGMNTTTLTLPLQMGYNQATQIRWPGECLNTPRPWPTGGTPVDVHDSTIPLDDKAIARFWAKVDTSGGPDACWPWTGSRQGRGGYGIVEWRGRPTRAHRLAYTLAVGTIPDGLYICHRCDVPACCNPIHLYAGTQFDNMRDCVERGRNAVFCGDESPARRYPERLARGNANGSYTHPERRPYGERNGKHTHPESRRFGSRNPKSKLSEADIPAILLEAEGGLSLRGIARRFGVSARTIGRIVRGEAWTHASVPDTFPTTTDSTNRGAS